MDPDGLFSDPIAYIDGFCIPSNCGGSAPAPSPPPHRDEGDAPGGNPGGGGPEGGPGGSGSGGDIPTEAPPPPPSNLRVLCSEAGMLPNELAGWCNITSRVSTPSVPRVVPPQVLRDIAASISANPPADFYTRQVPPLAPRPAVEPRPMPKRHLPAAQVPPLFVSTPSTWEVWTQIVPRMVVDLASWSFD